MAERGVPVSPSISGGETFLLVRIVNFLLLVQIRALGQSVRPASRLSSFFGGDGGGVEGTPSPVTWIYWQRFWSWFVE